MIRAPQRAGFNLANWLLAASIAGVAFAGGSVFATRFRQAPATQPQPTYALLLYGAEPRNDSATLATRAAEYSRWAGSVNAEGHVVGGEQLGTPVAALAVRVVGRGEDSVIVVEDTTGGSDFFAYYLVTAPDRETAVRIARNCPHLKYGGRVVVRRVNPSELPVRYR